MANSFPGALLQPNFSTSLLQSAVSSTAIPTCISSHHHNLLWSIRGLPKQRRNICRDTRRKCSDCRVVPRHVVRCSHLLPPLIIITDAITGHGASKQPLDLPAPRFQSDSSTVTAKLGVRSVRKCSRASTPPTTRFPSRWLWGLWVFVPS